MKNRGDIGNNWSKSWQRIRLLDQDNINFKIKDYLCKRSRGKARVSQINLKTLETIGKVGRIG